MALSWWKADFPPPICHHLFIGPQPPPAQVLLASFLLIIMFWGGDSRKHKAARHKRRKRHRDIIYRQWVWSKQNTLQLLSWSDLIHCVTIETKWKGRNQASPSGHGYMAPSLTVRGGRSWIFSYQENTCPWWIFTPVTMTQRVLERTRRHQRRHKENLVVQPTSQPIMDCNSKCVQDKVCALFSILNNTMSPQVICAVFYYVS